MFDTSLDSRARQQVSSLSVSVLFHAFIIAIIFFVRLNHEKGLVLVRSGHGKTENLVSLTPNVRVFLPRSATASQDHIESTFSPTRHGNRFPKQEGSDPLSPSAVISSDLIVPAEPGDPGSFPVAPT